MADRFDATGGLVLAERLYPPNRSHPADRPLACRLSISLDA
jgi:hypothetical protein